jgi:hypothetical protein
MQSPVCEFQRLYKRSEAACEFQRLYKRLEAACEFPRLHRRSEAACLRVSEAVKKVGGCL